MTHLPGAWFDGADREVAAELDVPVRAGGVEIGPGACGAGREATG